MSAASSPPDDSALRAIAAQWTIRRDRGLSASESIDYELWLAADPRHAAAMQRTSAAWSLLDRIPESAAAPVLDAATHRRSFWRRSLVLAPLATAVAAAVALVALHLTRPSATTPSASAALAPASASAVPAPSSAPRQLTLSDGTVVQLNTGGEVTEHFTTSERRVLLTRGEAHFAVTKNPARPFVVRAVGTAFNVNLQSAAVDVLVTEGKVSVSEVERVDPNALQRLAVKPLHPMRRFTFHRLWAMVLNDAVAAVRSPRHAWKKTSSSLEDVFISLMDQAKDNFA